MFFPKYIQKSTITKSTIKFFLFLRTGKIYMNLLHCFLDYLWKSSKIWTRGWGGQKICSFLWTSKMDYPGGFFKCATMRTLVITCCLSMVLLQTWSTSFTVVKPQNTLDKESSRQNIKIHSINPFHSTGLFLYSLKNKKNHRFSDVFRGYRMRPGAWNGCTC